jgi:hypothetical protein
MPLTYDLTKIADYKTKCWLPDGGINPVTERLIFLTMAVDIGEIKDSNWREFATRMFMLGLLDQETTAADVRDHVGLRCNVGDTTKAAFKNKVDKVLRRDAQVIIDRAVKTTIQEVGDAVAYHSQADGGNARST